MSYVIASTDMLSAAAANVAGIGTSLSAATAAAAPSTTSVIAAAEDEVSAAISSLFPATPRSIKRSALKPRHFIRSLCRP